MAFFGLRQERLPGVSWILHDRSVLIFGVAHEHVKIRGRYLYASSVAGAPSSGTPVEVTKLKTDWRHQTLPLCDVRLYRELWQFLLNLPVRKRNATSSHEGNQGSTLQSNRLFLLDSVQ